MNISVIEKIYVAILMIILGGIVIHAPLSVWLGASFPEYDLLIKSWKEILLIIAAIVSVALISRRKLWPQVLHDRLCQLLVVYITLHILVGLFLYRGLLPTAAGLAIDLRYIIFFGLTYVGLKLMPQYHRRFLWTAIIGAVIVLGFAILQLFLPADVLSHIGYSKNTIMPYLTVDKNPDYVRINSTLRGPNPLGAYAATMLALIAAAMVRKRIDLKRRQIKILCSLFVIGSLVALWTSYSRSALATALIAISIVFFVTVARHVSSRIWIVSTVVLFGLVGGFIAIRETSFVSNVIFHENTNGGSEVSSNEQHASSLEYGLAQLMREPFGQGIGSTGSASLYGDTHIIVENQYLFVAHETGWIGLILFIVIFTLIMHRLWRGRVNWLSLGVFASGIGLALIGLLQPVWVDDTVSIIWWGLAAIALAGKVGYERKKTK